MPAGKRDKLLEAIQAANLIGLVARRGSADLYVTASRNSGSRLRVSLRQKPYGFGGL